MIEAGAQVAVIGAGVTGQSVARYVRARGGEVLLLDTRVEPARNKPALPVQWGVRHWPADCAAKVAVVSPGLPLDACLLQEAKGAGVRLVSDIDVFFAAVDQPVIGITGTNGKSTVTSLAGHLLNEAGISTGVGGNLGQAALDIIAPEHQCYVLELSSFQLERSAVHQFYRSVILNISEDHLDHHGDVATYQQAKQLIYQAAQGWVVNRAEPLCQPLAGTMQASVQGTVEQVVSYGLDAPPGNDDWGIREVQGQPWICRGRQQVCALVGLPLQGQHNEENMLAAIALVYDLIVARLSAQQFAAWLTAALGTFRGLPHRFETVADIGGVRYINDSKATNLGATMAALQGMPQQNQVVLIAGGDAKGVDLSPLAAQLTGRVKHMLVIGAAAAHLVTVAKQASVTVQQCNSLTDAVTQAATEACQGDCVLLSPACSSLDMFDNFAQRGEQFAAAVNALVEAD